MTLFIAIFLSVAIVVIGLMASVSIEMAVIIGILFIGVFIFVTYNSLGVNVSRDEIGKAGVEIINDTDTGLLKYEDYVGEGYQERKWEKYLGKGLIYAALCLDADKTIQEGLSIYYVFDSNGKEYTYNSKTDKVYSGRPKVCVKQILYSTYTKNPDKLVYTSATVGGVTTGGFDVVKGGYTEHLNSTNKYSPFLGFGFAADIHEQAIKIWGNDAMMSEIEKQNVAFEMLGEKKKREESGRKLNSTTFGTYGISKESCERLQRILANE